MLPLPLPLHSSDLAFWLVATRTAYSRIFFSTRSNSFSDPDRTRGIVDFLDCLGNSRHPHHWHNFSVHLAIFQLPNCNYT